MGLYNVNDSPLEWLIDAVQGLLRENPFESASIEDGRVRFIGGLLLLQAGARLMGEGTFEWTGPGSIAGDWEVLGGGVIRVGGVLISPVGGGRIMIGEGPVAIILDGGTGTLTMGNIRMEGGKIYVGTGTNQVVIDGATGKIVAGNMTMDPTTSGGALVYANGAQVFTDDDTIQLFKGNSVVQVSDDYARLQHGGDVVEIDGDGIRMSPGAVPVADPGDDSGHWIKMDPTSGRFRRVPPGFGGPEGGAFEYPFPESTISDTFRPPNRPTHNGLDFAGPQVTGFMIPAASRGVVTFSGGSPTVTETSGYGYYVVVNHGIVGGHTVETLYAHMATTPTVAEGQTVAKGDHLGPVGNTGNSFGDHLHWEVHVDGEPVDPQAFMEQFAG